MKLLIRVTTQWLGKQKIPLKHRFGFLKDLKIEKFRETIYLYHCTQRLGTWKILWNHQFGSQNGLKSEISVKLSIGMHAFMVEKWKIPWNHRFRCLWHLSPDSQCWQSCRRMNLLEDVSLIQKISWNQELMFDRIVMRQDSTPTRPIQQFQRWGSVQAFWIRKITMHYQLGNHKSLKTEKITWIHR